MLQELKSLYTYEFDICEYGGNFHTILVDYIQKVN